MRRCAGVQGEVDGLRSATESALKKKHRATQMVRADAAGERQLLQLPQMNKVELSG